jgi:serine/threonine protein kinase
MAPEMFDGDSTGGNDHRLADIWSAGVCFYCMTECRFPFTAGGNGGAGGHEVHETNTQYLRIQKQIMKSEWRLKEGRPAVSYSCPAVLWIGGHR